MCVSNTAHTRRVGRGIGRPRETERLGTRGAAGDGRRERGGGGRAGLRPTCIIAHRVAERPISRYHTTDAPRGANTQFRIFNRPSGGRPLYLGSSRSLAGFPPNAVCRTRLGSPARLGRRRIACIPRSCGRCSQPRELSTPLDAHRAPPSVPIHGESSGRSRRTRNSPVHVVTILCLRIVFIYLIFFFLFTIFVGGVFKG